MERCVAQATQKLHISLHGVPVWGDVLGGVHREAIECSKVFEYEEVKTIGPRKGFYIFLTSNLYSAVYYYDVYKIIET